MNTDLVRELAAVIDAELFFSNWRLYALTLAVLAISKTVDVYLAKYWGKRAEIKANATDLQEVIRQLRATTEATEAVRVQMSKTDWLDKEWRSIRRVKLEELLCAANGMLQSLGLKAIDDPVAPTNRDSEKLRMLCALYFPELRVEVTDVYTTHKEFRIYFLESQSAKLSAATEDMADEIERIYNTESKGLYSRFVEAHFALEKAAAALMQQISLHEPVL